ncbi:hyaluronan synthase 2 [Dactylonectria estremocensis]|uniref:Hyaluronan synthase 2 n=1 Tax=Dactylonectria estremocensis TaxID=1079267 RepID=A0A9P9EW77_9HYPO|nr:hyaluronan synthase 2 [Dactylonectria estremocensis]
MTDKLPSVKFAETSAVLDSPNTSSASIKAPCFDSAATFDSPQRKPLKINPFSAALNITIAFGIIGAIITGYSIGLGILDLGITSVGLYGTILISEYLVQLSCAIINRFDVDRIVNNVKKKTANAQAAGDCENAPEATSTNALLNPGAEISIAVVGYREDEQAWRHCLRSLQTQTLRPKCVIGVVDGNKEPDLSMAQAFVDEFQSHNATLIHLPALLSEVHRKAYFDNVPADTRFLVKFWHYLVGRYRPGHEAALALAREAVVQQVLEWDNKWNIRSLKAVCFSQPHGHKRTAMFTAFAMSLYAIRTRDAIFTTDSDTLIQDNGLDEMLALLRSAPEIGGITADVKIWNRAESLLARMCSARYWFAFNIERACQSLWRCVGCLSGPMSMYRASDLETILGPWNLQTFGGKETTFGDDRHLTNQLLAQGLRTRYTHRTWCDSESPTSFVRWVAQQTRWSKSFFRESFWFPASFAYQSPWMLLEMTIQALYPFILIATVFRFLFDTSDSSPWRPVIWLVTMFGVALLKSILAVLISRDPWLLLFSAYGFIYFFGLLPTKIYALMTINQTGWGTSARSSSERKRGQSFLQRSFHICHLVIWYAAIFVGLGFFISKVFGNPLYLLVGAFALLPTAFLYWQGSISLGGLFAKKKKASEASTPFQVDESMLPQKPSPALSTTSSKRSSNTRVETSSAVSVKDATDEVEKQPKDATAG